MSDASEDAAQGPLFSPRAILILVLVGIVAAAGLAVLSAYAPDLRTGNDGRAHALSKSAVGYAAAPILLKGLGAPVVVSRNRPTRPGAAATVLTPELGLSARELQAYPKGALTLIVLPKWLAANDPIRQGFVRKIDAVHGDAAFSKMLESYAPKSAFAMRKGKARPALRGVDGGFEGLTWQAGQIDRLRTISGTGWTPLIVDEAGNAVLAQSRKAPGIWVLADPDLLNNQGLGDLANARIGAAILQTARRDDGPVVFDVTLAGYARGRGLGRVMLEPPWLAATLCAAAAVMLMGVHALARFGQPRRRGRAFALGAAALVDNAADLIRAARKEAELAPAYAALNRALVLKAAGGHLEEHWLEDLAARRGATAPAALAQEAQAATTRDDLLAVAQKLYDWRGEMTRERR